jgi:hypothetical protein
MDLGGFYSTYRKDGIRRRAHDAGMMAALLL